MFNFPASPNQSPLRKFIALQRDALLILGPRRVPPLSCSASSTSSSISIVTSLGFRTLECADYVEAVQKLRPDIILGMGDILFGHTPGVKRADKMGDRTLAWLIALVEGMKETNGGTPNTELFAPILPIDAEKQSYYLDALQDELKDNICGLVLYDTSSVAAIPENLRHLPRLWLGPVDNPHKILDAIALGTDMFTVPFITEVTDVGIALDFTFGCGAETDPVTRLPLGIDLWSSSYSVDLSPLRTKCNCYACTSHHKAFVQHLLNAKEMLGWVLLQLHNHHVVNEFFERVRQSIQRGSFLRDCAIFGRAYEAELPAKTGQGPR